jgi:MOSC domain-containing protein YiiM
MTGRILRLSIKPKIPGEYGLPKQAVAEMTIGINGAAGDYNHYRATKLKGDPDQAILVVTREVLDQLQREGWPVEPGDLGENLTLGDVPESALVAGTRLELGVVRLEITKRCEPCTELHSLPYVGKGRGVAFVRTMVDRRGWYARVLSGGVLSLDTPVHVTGAVVAPS